MNEVSEALRSKVSQLRVKPIPLSEVIPLMQQAADEIDRLAGPAELCGACNLWVRPGYDCLPQPAGCVVAKRAIDWGAVDEELIRIVGCGPAPHGPIISRLISDLRMLLRKVSGQ